MNDGLAATLERILTAAQERAAYEELRGDSPAYRPDCPTCDGTGWQMLTSGSVTTTGGAQLTASPAIPVATRCPKGCKPRMSGRKTERQTPTKRELTP